MRITGPEMRAAYYAVRRRLGYVDTVRAGATRDHVVNPASLGLISAKNLRGPHREAPAPAELAPGRLLAAKKRATRR